jgi:hypothetical protein
MQTKLTLRLDDKLIKRAKAHAKRTGRSLSQLVGDYFSILGAQESRGEKLTPKVSRLKGVLRGHTDTRTYRKYLEDKHL